MSEELELDELDIDELDVGGEFELDIPSFGRTDGSVRAPLSESGAGAASGHDPTSTYPPTHAPAHPPAHERRDAGADDPVADPATRRNLCLAFQGVGGGAGTTSLAIATAHQLSRRARGQVCLVDLDFELGACAHYLDIGTTPRMDDLRVDPSRVDDTYVRALVSHHSSGLAVMASPCEPGGNDTANPAAVIGMLDRLAEMYPVLVLDVGRVNRPWTDAALLAADRVALVAELHIPALHLARQALSRLDNAGVARTDVVINKYERRSFKASIRIKDAERALGREVGATVGLDMQAPFEAINCGEPGGRLEAEGRYGRDLMALAVALAPELAEKRADETKRASGARPGLARRLLRR